MCLSSSRDDPFASGTQANHVATRTSTRPPPVPTSTPCPYRTGLSLVGFLNTVGAGVDVGLGGDACVALGAGRVRPGTGRGRRKRPLPAQPHPRPYGYATAFLKKPTSERQDGEGRFRPLPHSVGKDHQDAGAASASPGLSEALFTPAFVYYKNTMPTLPARLPEHHRWRKRWPDQRDRPASLPAQDPRVRRPLYQVG